MRMGLIGAALVARFSTLPYKHRHGRTLAGLALVHLEKADGVEQLAKLGVAVISRIEFGHLLGNIAAHRPQMCPTRFITGGIDRCAQQLFNSSQSSARTRKLRFLILFCRKRCRASAAVSRRMAT